MEDEEVTINFHEDVGIRHSELLIPTIRDMVKYAKITVKDIDLISTETT